MSFTAARAFSSASSDYDDNAGLQQQAAHWLGEGVQLQGVCLDVGCGTGLLGKVLPLQQTLLYGLDLAWGMLEQHSDNYAGFVCSDMSCLPFVDGSMGGVVSNLALQWASCPEAVLGEVARILRPGGTFVFTVPAPGSLQELAWSWQQLGDEFAHINSFDSQEVWLARLEQAFAGEAECESRTFVRWFDTPLEAVRSLKKVGANRVTQGARQGLTGKSAYADMLKYYASLRQERGIPLTYKLLRLKTTA